nr:MAG TPA: scaffold protein [Bacteriophage sp.]
MSVPKSRLFGKFPFLNTCLSQLKQQVYPL